MARILALDDERDQLIIIRSYLSSAGHETLLLQDSTKVQEIIREHQPDILVTDIMMPGLTGGSVYELVREEFGKMLPILIVSGTRLRLKSALQDPLLGYCPKPISQTGLLLAVEDLLVTASKLPTLHD